MTVPIPTPSRRLLRAAAAEHAELTRHRDRLARRREGLLADLRRLDEALQGVDRRLSVLAELAEASDPGCDGAEVTPESTSGSETPEHLQPDMPRQVLRGPAIREVAVQVLIDQPERIDALHYRRWYELVREAGYAVAGKDPPAVFLTQVTRSPVVRKSSEAGVYEVDRQAPLRIRQRLERLQAELREVALSSDSPVELGVVRARRHELDLAISQQERALEEAVRVLGRREPGTPRTGASSGR